MRKTFPRNAADIIARRPDPGALQTHGVGRQTDLYAAPYGTWGSPWTSPALRHSYRGTEIMGKEDHPYESLYTMFRYRTITVCRLALPCYLSLDSIGEHIQVRPREQNRDVPLIKAQVTMY
jgi:hypothetical protein